ncbi:MAG: DEAD/DEAH box helicase, partial [Verrucomicrobiota bacterium]
MADSRLTLPDLWQQDALRALRQGEDVVIQAPTGAGKTYVFELLIRGGHRG